MIYNADNSEKKFLMAFKELENSIFRALATYSNVHRGTGHNSMITTTLFERAREIILKYLQLNHKYVVVFCSPLRVEKFKLQLKSKSYSIVSSKDFGLPLGVRAIAVRKKDLRKCSAFYTGGGMIKHVTSNSVIWADIPERFEAGTPNIVNIIALAKYIQLVEAYGQILKGKQQDFVKTQDEILYNDKILEYSGEELLEEVKKSLIGRFLRVPTVEGMKNFVNLDNAASTRSFVPIWNTFRKALWQPIKSHQKIIQSVKEICSSFLNASLEEYEIIFTSNATEAINIIAQNLTDLYKNGIKSTIINTVMEHHSNELPFRYIPEASLIRLTVDNEGFIDFDEFENILRDQDSKNGKNLLVTISGVSNVLGTCNDLQRISQITHKYGGKLLVDGAQLVAHHKTDLKKYNLDYLVFSGHKMYAPFGSGVLIAKKGNLTFDTNKIAMIKSSGEENIVGIATLGKSILLLNRIGINLIEKYESKLTHYTLDKLNEMNGVEIFGIKSSESNRFKRRSGIISFSLEHVPHNLASKELAEYGGIGIRNGCFCAHMLIQKILGVQQIRILGAMMTSIIVPKQTAICLPGTLRVSFGIENNKSDIDQLVQTIEKISKRPRSLINKLLAQTHNGTLFLEKTKTEEKIKRFVEKVVSEIYPTAKS
ncbi:MAG: aminotransferase class V-fold PLP-dependent enzyme [Candidatus Thorarchaeota archaeon]